MNIKRGEIYYADLSPVVGSEQGGIRPVLVVQNDVGNKYSPTVIVAAITSQLSKAKLPNIFCFLQKFFSFYFFKSNADQKQILTFWKK